MEVDTKNTSSVGFLPARLLQHKLLKFKKNEEIKTSTQQKFQNNNNELEKCSKIRTPSRLDNLSDMSPDNAVEREKNNDLSFKGKTLNFNALFVTYSTLCRVPGVIINTVLSIGQVVDYTGIQIETIQMSFFRFTLGRFGSSVRVSDISNEAQTAPTGLHISPEISNNGLYRNMSKLDGNDESSTLSGLPALNEGAINLR